MWETMFFFWVAICWRVAKTYCQNMAISEKIKQNKINSLKSDNLQSILCPKNNEPINYGWPIKRNIY
jgi:hypothetical protein